ncbi:MAG: YdcF family protein [Alphaproteobacteria bacterium]|nr:YdcF family protein [Alphaproteobacteria bacterium]
MEFVLGKLFWLAAQPSSVLFILLALGSVGLLLRPHARRPRRLLLAASLCLLFGALVPVGRWLHLPLEERFPRPDRLPDRVDGIVVLGGALQPMLTADRGQPALNEHAERMIEAVRLARLLPDARLIFTGGSGALLPGRLTEADVARELLAGLGLPAERLLFEAQSRNTAENASHSRRLADPKPDEVWLLVTSARHMPRSVGAFRAAGWKVLAWPVDYETGREEAAGWRFAPLANLRLLDAAAYEWTGLLAYRLLGHSDDFFPAP